MSSCFHYLLTNRSILFPEWHSWPAAIRANRKKYSTIAIPLSPLWLKWRVNYFLISLLTHFWPNAPILHSLPFATWVRVRSIISCSETSLTQAWDFLRSKQAQCVSKQHSSFYFIYTVYHCSRLSRLTFILEPFISIWCEKVPEYFWRFTDC